jgi:hypothetical protein
MKADPDKTTATTEVVSSQPEKTRHWSQNCRRKTSTPENNRWRTEKMTEKMSCKTMKQDENEQNHKNESTPVVDNKPNGKSRIKDRRHEFHQ